MEPKFSGHETFPLRHGWLYKSVNLLNKKTKLSTSNSEDVQDAIVELGVGKNMVNAIRYWSEACSVIRTQKNDATQSLTDIGKYLFLSAKAAGSNIGIKDEKSANDPFLEKLGSVWLVHFLLNFDESTLTSYRYFFNLCSMQVFEKDKLVFDIANDVNTLCSKSVNESTIKKDLDCFLHSYASKSSSVVKKSTGGGEEHYALREDGDEAGAIENRCDFKDIDYSKGSATGYIAKYVSKNVLGANSDSDIDGGNAIEASQRVEAWANCWGIR